MEEQVSAVSDSQSEPSMTTQGSLEGCNEQVFEILDRVPCGVVLVDSKGVCLHCNDDFTAMTGYTMEDIATGRDWFLKAFPDKKHRKTVIESWPGEGDRELAVTCKDGTVKKIEFRINTLASGNMIIVMPDNTHHRKVKAAFVKAEEKYRLMYENAMEGMFQITPEGKFISANPALARIFGYESPKKLMAEIGHMGAQLFESQKRWDEYLQLMETNGLVHNFDLQTISRDGNLNWISVNAQVVQDDEGNVLYHQGTAESIAERKRLEAQLRHAQKMESVGTLAGGVAHDFNNILTAIMGYASLMLMKAAEGHPFRRYIDQIMEAADKASTLTQSLLAFSRRQAAEVKTIEVNESIRSIEKLLRRLVGEDIEVVIDLAPEKLVILMGDGHIGQLLMNLATNARDAMPTGGTLTIKTEQAHLSGEFVKSFDAAKEGVYCCIEVSDTGAGMDERTKDQIFDPFFTTKEVGKGSGLGLSIVYGVVNQNNGYVTVDSERDKGTTFSLYFPLTEPARGVETLKERPELRGNNEVILVAEDSRQVREIVTLTLTDFGYTVVEAVDGQDAVDKFKMSKGEIDLLLLDIIMPGKNGKATYLEIKKIRPEIRAIFMSGYTGDILSRKGISREGIPLISKPIVIERLLKMIREVLDQKPSQLSLFS
jgi:PAS domain S-box-containing protein